MGNRYLAAAILTALVASPALADGFGKGQTQPGQLAASATGGGSGGSLSTGQTTHDVTRGDTMWGLSGRYWNNKFAWPKMWSYNPQVHNPHWIYPGQKLFLSDAERAAAAEAKAREIQLVVEKLTPDGQGGVMTPAAKEAAEAARAKAAEETARAKGEAEAAKAAADAAAEAKRRATVTVSEGRTQDYLAGEPLARIGTVGNKQAVKVLSAKTEEVQFEPASSGSVKVGDRLTIFDDSRVLTHPVTGAPAGRQVRVLGDMVVTSVDGGTAWGKVLTSYDAIEDGHGLMPYREPITAVEKTKSGSRVEGVVIAGYQDFELFSNDDAIFLDKGKDDGIVPGTVVNLAYPPGPFQAEGYTENLRVPMARAIIVSAQARTSTAWIFDSAKAVEAGFRFTASADSP